MPVETLDGDSIPIQVPIGGQEINFHSGPHSVMVWFTIPLDMDMIPVTEWNSLKKTMEFLEGSIQNILKYNREKNASKDVDM